MELQNKISSYLNGENFPKYFLGGELSSLKKNIVKNTNEKKFISFAKSYKLLYEKESKSKKKIVNKIEKLEINKGVPFLRPLAEFRDYIANNFNRDELIGAYIHGSLGTYDYIEGYSDFDAILIIKGSVLENDEKIKTLKKKITKLNTFLYLLDPLQHHNLFIISELDMKYYFESIFPVILFKYVKEVTDYRNKLVFSCLPDDKHTYYSLKKRLQMFSKPKKYKFNKKHVYHIKNSVQNILLLPTLYLQIKNKKYLYKKHSFNIAKKDFTKRDWDIIIKCSTLREKYSYKSIYPYFFRKFVGLYLHHKALKALHLYLDKNDFKKMIKILGNNYLSDAEKLSKKMVDKTKNGK